MTDIVVEYKNQLRATIRADRSTLQEIWDSLYYTFPNFQFTPAYKSGRWDGKIRLLNLRDCSIYKNMLPKLMAWARDAGYSFDIEDKAKFRPAVKFDPAWLDRWAEYGTMEPMEHQRKYIADALKWNQALLLSPTSCHAPGDKVLMSDGRFKNIECVSIGDRVIGADGRSKEVLSVYSGEDVMYRVKPRGNGEAITVTGSHLLPIRYSDASKKYGYAKGDPNKIDFVPVEHYINKPAHYKHCANLVYSSVGVEHTGAAPLPVSPYFLGVYLGDGSGKACCVTSVDPEIIDAVYAEAELHGMDVVTCDEGYGYAIRGRDGKRNKLFAKMRTIGLNFGGADSLKCADRFVPDCVYSLPLADRLQFMAGLIDADGNLCNGTAYDMEFKAEGLARGIYELAVSVGLIPTASSRIINGTTYHRVRIGGDISRIPVRIPRKVGVKIPSRNPYNAKFDVECMGVGKFYGIGVEDRLYVTNGGMVTHNSGKSYIMYLSIRWLLENTTGKILITVPSTSLVEQMFSDFEEYAVNWNVGDHVHKIYDGAEKTTSKRVILSTWQSIVNLPPAWYSGITAYFCDEAHQADKDSITGIVDKLENCPVRIALTGTLNGTKVHEMELKGRFGPTFQHVTTAELMRLGLVAKLSIVCKRLKYTQAERKAVYDAKDYDHEIDYIVKNEKRNQIIVSDALECDGNALILFNFVERHGDVLHKMLQEQAEAAGKIVFYLHGKVKTEERERIRKLMDDNVFVDIFFGDEKITVHHEEEVVLTTGVSIKAKYVDETTDVCDAWIRTKLEKC